MYNGLDFEVQKYGTLIDQYDFPVDGHYLTFKVYKYNDEIYTETWSDGIRTSFVLASL